MRTSPSPSPHFEASRRAPSPAAPGAPLGAAAVAGLVALVALGAGCPRLAAEAQPNQAPIAKTAAANLEAHAGDVVALDGSGSVDPDGDTLTFQWSAAGGSVVAITDASEAKASFVAPATGGHIFVQLVVDDGTDESAPALVDVHVNAAPVAAVSGPASTPDHVAAALIGSADDEPGSTLAFSWRAASAPAGSACAAGDGSACFDDAAASAVAFTPDHKGTYAVELVVDDGDLQSAPARLTLTAENRAPVAVAVSSASAAGVRVHSGDVVTLSAAGSSDPDGDALTLSWHDPVGPAAGVAQLDAPEAEQTGFTAQRPGVYTVGLVVTDTDGVSADASVTVAVDDSPPVLTAPDVASTVAGSAVSVVASAVDIDGDPVSFLWSLVHAPAGADAALDGADTAQVRVTPSARTTVSDPAQCATNADACYLLRVTAGDGALVASADVFLVATDRAPTVTVVTPSPLAATAGAASALSAAADDADGDGVTLSWRVADATPGGEACLASPDACLSGAATATPLFTAPVPGTYLVEVTVADVDAANNALGGTATASLVVEAAAGPPPENVRPVAVISVDAAQIASGGTVQLDGSASTDPDTAGGAGVNADGIASFSWSVIDGPAGGVSIFSPASADVEAPALTLRGRGAWTVQLVVTDGDGATGAPATVSIGVDNAAPTVDTVTADGADAAAGVAVQNGTAVALQAFASDVDPFDVAGLTFQWQIVDAPAGGGGVLTGGATATPTFTPTEKTAVTDPALCTAGACYVLQVTVSDGLDTGSATVTVTSANRAPVADAGADQPDAVETVALDGSASFDPDGDAIDPASFVWTQTQGPDVTGGAGALSGAFVTFQAPVAGAYAFSLTVSDGQDTSAPDVVTVVVDFVDQPPVVSAPVSTFTAVAGDDFALHVDASDPDFDNVGVAWTLTAGDAALFPATLSGTDPAPTAPSLKALLDDTRGDGGDNSATYEVVATDPRGKTSPPVSVTLFVLPGAEHIVVAPDDAGATDDPACGSVAAPCLTFENAFALADAQARDLVAVGGAFTETPAPPAAPGPATLALRRTLWGGRNPATFARVAGAPTSITCADGGAGTGDVTCVTLDAAADDTVLVDDASFAVDPAVPGAQVALHCDGCAATFTDVDLAAGLAAPDAGPASATALIIDGTAAPIFFGGSMAVTGTCDPVGVSVGAGADVEASDLVVTADFTRTDCVKASASAVRVRAGAFTGARLDAAVTTGVALGGAALDLDLDGALELDDSRVAVDSGDGLGIVDGAAVITRSTLGSTGALGAADGAGLRTDAAAVSASATLELTVVTGFAAAAVLDDGGDGVDLTTCAVADAVAGASTCAGVAFDPVDPSTCSAVGLDDAFGRACLFTADFHLVDDVANACIDAEDAAGATATDLDGDPRPDAASGLFDVGFDEL